MRQSDVLRAALTDSSNHPLVFVGAVSPLAAYLIQSHGFAGCWVGSLEVATTLLLPDRNLVGLRETAEVVAKVRTATSLPIAVDVENGYGTLESSVRAAKEFTAAGASLLCVDDNVFPKENSLVLGVPRPLQSATDFTRRVAAVRAGGEKDGALVVARTEALIAGLGLKEAMRRSHLAVDAGADVVLVHSRDPTGVEATEVAERWDFRVPLMTIPTMFQQYTAPMLADLGYRIVVFANQLVRASHHAMSDALQTLQSEGAGGCLIERMTSVEVLLKLLDESAIVSKARTSSTHTICDEFLGD